LKNLISQKLRRVIAKSLCYHNNMKIKLNFVLLIVFASLVIGCGTTHYVLNDETPSLNTGFFYFRWTTPMGIVNSEFPQITGAQPRLDLNRYKTSCFSNTDFLGELINVCEFSFDEKGLNSIKIIFLSSELQAEENFLRFKEKLTTIYGEPRELLNGTNQYTEQEYILNYYWNDKMLELTLKPDYTIEINVHSYSPLYGPIHNG